MDLQSGWGVGLGSGWQAGGSTRGGAVVWVLQTEPGDVTPPSGRAAPGPAEILVEGIATIRTREPY